jgi:hypothetical protein
MNLYVNLFFNMILYVSIRVYELVHNDLYV